jgi:hypothetical protein
MEVDENDFKQLLGLLKQLVEKTAENSVAQSNTQKVEVETDQDDGDYNNETEDEQVVVKETKKQRGPVVSKNSSSKFENKFLNMREASMHQDDTKIDKKLNRLPPTQRSRRFQYVDVKCRVCGKTEKVTPALADARDRYKCNRCSTSPG